jgi:hypothetical protein
VGYDMQENYLYRNPSSQKEKSAIIGKGKKKKDKIGN